MGCGLSQIEFRDLPKTAVTYKSNPDHSLKGNWRWACGVFFEVSLTLFSKEY